MVRAVLRIVRDRRGSVVAMAALLAPTMLGAVALTTDMSMWYLEQHRLQIAADAGAHAAAMQLQNTAFQTGQASAFAKLVSNEVQAATGGSLIGKLNTPVLSVASGYSSITVTLTSKADTFFANAVYSKPVTMRATATAGVAPAKPCVLALSPTASKALMVDGNGKIAASGCPVFSDSSASDSLYANGSGNITARTIGTAGGYTQSNAGSVSPAPTTNATKQDDPGSGYTLPSAGSCSHTNYNLSASGNNIIYPGTYCGTTFIGGNGGTYAFRPGPYIFTGNVTINNANITQGAGITFILMGSTPSANAGTFSWSNNSATTVTAPPLGAAYAGLLLWQACPSGKAAGSNVNGLVDFTNGGALTASGAIYAPCGPLKLENNTQVKPTSDSSVSVVAATVSVIGGAVLTPGSSSSGSGGGAVALSQ